MTTQDKKCCEECEYLDHGIRLGCANTFCPCHSSQEEDLKGSRGRVMYQRGFEEGIAQGRKLEREDILYLLESYFRGLIAIPFPKRTYEKLRVLITSRNKEK